MVVAADEEGTAPDANAARESVAAGLPPEDKEEGKEAAAIAPDRDAAIKGDATAATAATAAAPVAMDAAA